MKLSAEKNKQFNISTKEAFTEAYEKYNKAVYLNVRKIIQDDDYAMDVMHNVFAKLWENRHKFNDKSLTEGWLFTISYNESISFLRKKIRLEITSLDDQSDILMEAEDNYDEDLQIRMQAISEALVYLPPRKKEIFMLSRFEGKSMEEISEITELPQASVRSHINQANKVIKRYIGNRYPHLISSSFSLYLTLC